MYTCTCIDAFMYLYMHIYRHIHDGAQNLNNPDMQSRAVMSQSSSRTDSVRTQKLPWLVMYIPFASSPTTNT